MTGYATIIGYLSQKILGFTTRNRKFSKCDNDYSKDDNDCRLNFQGSAKDIKADAGVKLTKKSRTSKEKGLNVRVVIEDEESSTTAAVRKGSDKFFHKSADKNHHVKHFTSESYELAKKYKQLNKKGAINHLKKCFTYAIAQNKGHKTQLTKILRKVYGQHENCRE